MGISKINTEDEFLLKEDKKISVALMSTFVILTAQYLILIFLNLFGSNMASRIQLLSKGIVGLVFVYAIPAVLRRNTVKFIFVYFTLTIVIMFHYLIFENNRPYITDMLFPIYTMSLPCFIYALSIRDFSVFKSIMKKAGNVVFIIGFIVAVFVFTGRISFEGYSMAFSNYMLLPAIVFIDDLLDKYSFKMLILFILTLIIILSVGSRGTILCLVVFAILKFFKRGGKRSYLRLIGNVCFIGSALLLLIFSDKIIMYLYSFIGGFGINSRTLRLFLSKDLYLSGRDRIYDKVLSEISEHLLFGIGIGGDRYILNGAYSHNIFIEIIANFGIFIGGIIIILIFICIIKALLQKNSLNYSIIAIWLCIGFVHFMVSNSYIVDMRFWIFLGVLLNIEWINPKMKGEGL